MKIGDRVMIPDGRAGTITDIMKWGQYAVEPDDPTPDEVVREIRFLIDFDKAVIVKEGV